MISEFKDDLFNAPADFYFAHCISADFALGAGIAKIFRDRFSMKNKLFQHYYSGDVSNIGKALLIDNCFNLVTKELYFHKPTYDSLMKSLFDMKRQCIVNNITKLAMPRIGCGLDRLEWGRVKSLIETVFYGYNVEIRVYSL